MSTVKLPCTFGSLRLIEIDCGDDMMLLFAAMQEDPTAKLDGFCHLFGNMLDWRKDSGQLYVASCEETDEMRSGHTDISIFVRDGFPWILPAFVAGESAGHSRSRQSQAFNHARLHSGKGRVSNNCI